MVDMNIVIEKFNFHYKFYKCYDSNYIDDKYD